MVNEIKSALKGWYKPAVVLVVLVFGVGIGLTNAAASRTEPAPTPIAQRVRTEITDKVNAEGLVGTGVTLQDSNQPLNPPGGNQPLPKFSGLNVQGPILSEGVKPLMFFDDAMLYGLTDVRNGLVNGAAAPGGVAAPLTIYDNLRIAGAGAEAGDLFVGGLISGPVSGMGDTVGIKNNLGVTGDLFVNGSNIIFGGASASIQGNIIFNDETPVEFMSGINVNGNINNPIGGDITFTDNLTIGSGGAGAATNKNLTVNGNIDLRGSISNQSIVNMIGKPISINDNLNVTGTTTIGSAATPKNLTVNGNITAAGDGIGGAMTANNLNVSEIANLADSVSGVHIADDLNVTGSIISDLVIGNAGATKNLTVSGTSTLNGTLNIGGSLSNPNPNGVGDGGPSPWGNNAPVIINDGLSVIGTSLFQGSIKATNGFGSYTREPSAVMTVAAGEAKSVAATCPNVSTLISCTPATDSDVNFSSASWSSYVQIMSVYPDPNTKTCTMWGKNTGAGADKYFRVYAICLNPNP